MNKFQLLVISLSLSVSGWVHAGTSAESNSGERAIVVHSYASSASFSSDAGKPLARNGNINKVSAPYFLQATRVSHVPEPEGWAMMLMGAGFVVYQVRRRKRARESWDLR